MTIYLGDFELYVEHNMRLCIAAQGGTVTIYLLCNISTISTVHCAQGGTVTIYLGATAAALSSPSRGRGRPEMWL